MKLTVFIITISCMQLSAKVYSQKITLSGENITLEKALKTIEQQSGYFFLYKYNELQKAKPISVHFENKSITDALNQCLKGQPFTYTIENKTIVVTPKNETPESVQPVLKSIKGKVVDEKGQPLPGSSVMIKGTKIGAVTNVNGEFELNNVPDAAILTVSFIGYKTKEVSVKNISSVVTIALDLDESSLNEVVVTGLATSIKRSNAASSISHLSSQQLAGTTPPVTIDGAMSGKIVGANINSNSGAPGGGISVKLRGISSINGSSEPLYVVDGVFVNNSQFSTGAGASAFSGAGTNQDQATNRLSDINPADIESIEVLKGPSAGAIYGTRANAGVVIITTKKGKAGQTRVNVSQDVGFVSAEKLLGAEGWSLDPIGPQGQNKFDYVFGTGVAGSGSATEIAAWKAATAAGKIYDYEKIIYGNIGKVSNTTASVSGGTDKTKYYLASGLDNETGIEKRTGFQRRSVKVNLDQKLTDFWSFSIGSNYLNTGNQRGFSGNDNRGVSVPYTLAYTPNYAQLLPVDGKYPDSPYTGDNPLAISDRAVNNEITNRFIQSFSSTLYLMQKPNQTLKFAFSGGLDYVLTEDEIYFPDDLQSQRTRANGAGASRFSKNRSFNTNYQGFLIDNWKIKNIDFTTQVGVVKLSTKNDFSWIQGEGLLPGQENPNNATVRTSSETFQNWTDVGFVGQQEINWDDKVIATGGIRFDKSTLNGDNNKLYAFPRASVALNLTKFDFWKAQTINEFKLRLAYGRTGGEPAFGNTFTSLATTSYGGLLGTVTPTTVGNSTIQPETAQEIEMGTDIALFNGRLTFEGSYYIKNVYNLLNPYVLSDGTGVLSYIAYPVGDLQNKGIELALGGTPVKLPNFAWTTNLQFWNNRTKVTRLVIPNTTVGSGFSIYGRNQLRLGQSPSAWYGSPNVVDASGIAQATQYEDAQPKYQVSWSNTFTFLKNFDFSFLLHRSYGNFNSNLTQKQKDAGGTSIDWSHNDNLWGLTGVPNGKARSPSNPNVTAREFIQDASYLRLREVALYYNIPKSFLTTAFHNTVQSVKLGASATNLFTITQYQGYDPEASNFGNQSVGASVDNSAFPSSKRIFIRLAVGF
ncbi:SusC/RagA family TonB-linked outer membrane protein [Mucilaginibacter sp.]|uniref:SusC/RagA family TonB-linked outer membrane protein n=1 Tax=Mucilaginibacter sp. TaxID=1882438 RepID=UPI00261CAE09|nr:SusC/RagA family TonB-linked outer membrane protein [Mucilaginibacter sp.]